MDWSEIQVWPVLAGLGLFLFGMLMMEEALKSLTGRSFKKFLRKHTGNSVKAVLSGTLITAILQSSSMVSLLVMSFAGAGIIGLKNGIGIIMGANLGSLKRKLKIFNHMIISNLNIKNSAFIFAHLLEYLNH
jgi:phosphate:Na+ symporter